MILCCSLWKNIHTVIPCQINIFRSKTTLQLPWNVANMELTISWYSPWILAGHQTSPRTAKPAPQAQEHLTTHRDHWTKADQENLDESEGQGNCWSMLNTASDSCLYCLTPASTPWSTFDPHSTHITVKSELHSFVINATVTSVLFSR
jgi:hypothetical protein